MFTDYWVIAQLLAQMCALILLLYASAFGVQSLRYWLADSDAAFQLQLERQNYLMSAIMQVGLWFQVLSLFIFLHTVNTHLPPLIKGAMCATGTLGSNIWGYPLLALKSLAIFVYAIYLFTNYLDNHEPAYPLTPQKYIWLYPALGLSILDIYMLVQYFAHIEPNLIATCCSVDFNATPNNPEIFAQRGLYLKVLLGVWVASFFILIAGNYTKLFQQNTTNASIGLFLGGLYVFTAIYVLKYFFVKYIYGLPSHLCLFDIFWYKYYSIGYALFGSYYAILIAMLGNVVWRVHLPKLSQKKDALPALLRYVAQAGACISFILPVLYWIFAGYSF